MRHLLVLDADQVFQHQAQSIAQDLGFTVSVAENRENAILEMVIKRPDLIIADAETKGITGLELITSLEAFNPRPKLIFTVWDWEAFPAALFDEMWFQANRLGLALNIFYDKGKSEKRELIRAITEALI